MLGNRRLILVAGIVGIAAVATTYATYVLSQQCDRQAAAIWLLGAGAFVASLTALFSEEVRRWIWRPVITPHYLHNADHCHLTQFGNGAQCYYFSLSVSNDGERSATTVEVYVGDLWHKSGDLWQHVLRYGLNLKWAYVGTRSLETLASGMQRYCNIGHIIDPAQRASFVNENLLPHVAADVAILSLDLESQPNSGIHLLEPGTYRLTLQIVAANHEPVRRQLEFTVTGAWIANDVSAMLQQGIQMTLV